MSGTTSAPVTTAIPVTVPGAFFYDNTPQIAAALDLQTAIAQATALLTNSMTTLQAAQQEAQQTLATAQTAIQVAQQAVNNANYFLSGNIAGLPSSPEGVPVGGMWLDNGAPSVVLPSGAAS